MPSTEVSKIIPYKELSNRESLHLRKQLYYFFPFVRTIYEAINRQEKSSSLYPVNPASLEDIKDLSIHYASSMIYGEFSLDREQELIDKLYADIGLPPEELYKLLNITSVNNFNSRDGNIRDYIFGSKKSKEIDDLELPGGPNYSMGVAEGMLAFSQKVAHNLVEDMSTYFVQNNEGQNISILGNVARGIIDAAALHVGLKMRNIKSDFHLYRSSTHAVDDKSAILINEVCNPESWGIAVDSFTAKGYSVPQSLKMLEEVGFRKKSMFLTFMGYEWAAELGIEHQWEHYQGEGSYSGTLLYGDYSRIPQKYKN